MSTSKYFERLRRLLLVEPDKILWSILAVSLRGLAHVDSVADFQTAGARLWRASLFKTPFDLLVTNMPVPCLQMDAPPLNEHVSARPPCALGIQRSHGEQRLPPHGE